MGKIVSFVSQKGGVGKSTLARSLAREVSTNELTVKIADLDPRQGTTFKWYQRRLKKGHDPIGLVESFKTVKKAMMSQIEYDLLIIDGPPHASQETLEMATIADLIVQPSGACLDDLEPGVLLFHELVKAHIPQDKLCFALCRVGSASEERDCRDYIKQAGYKILDGCLYEKIGYRKAQDGGLSITETSYKGLNKKADVLIQSLFDTLWE